MNECKWIKKSYTGAWGIILYKSHKKIEKWKVIYQLLKDLRKIEEK